MSLYPRHGLEGELRVTETAACSLERIEDMLLYLDLSNASGIRLCPYKSRSA